MKILTKPFMTWLLITALWLTGSFWLGYTGMLTLAWQTDHFFVVTFMTSWFVLISIYLGYLAREVEKSKGINEFVETVLYDKLQRRLTIAWFSSSSLLNIGLIGTVIGFIAMLTSAFIGKSFSDPSVLVEIMQNMGSAWASALFATATGLIGAVIIQIQAFLVNIALEIRFEER